MQVLLMSSLFSVAVYKMRMLMDQLQQNVGQDPDKKPPAKPPRSVLSAHSWLESFMCDLLLKKSDAGKPRAKFSNLRC